MTAKRYKLYKEVIMQCIGGTKCHCIHLKSSGCVSVWNDDGIPEWCPLDYATDERVIKQG